MKISKIKLVAYISAALVGVLLLTAGVLYYVASSVPAEYCPENLTPEQRKQAAKDFFNEHFAKFNNIAHNTTPAKWSITQKQLNAYLASMDEIAELPPDSRRNDVNKQLDSAGLAAPAAKLHDGVLTLMIRAKEYNKVISADIAFQSVEEGKLQVKLVAARVGNLTVPRGFVGDRLNELKASLIERMKRRQEERRDPTRHAAGHRATPTGASLEDVQRVLTGVISAIDEPPMRPEFVWPIGRKRVRIDKVEITEGQATLHITPLGRAKRKR